MRVGLTPSRVWLAACNRSAITHMNDAVRIIKTGSANPAVSYSHFRTVRDPVLSCFYYETVCEHDPKNVLVSEKKKEFPGILRVVKKLLAFP